MSTIQPAHYSQCGCHTAQGDRQVLSSFVCTEGIVPDLGGGLLVSPTVPASMSVIVASGNAFIQGDNASWQGMYHVSNDGDVTLTALAADPAQDRIDIVVAEVRDATFAGPDCDWRLRIIPGTPGGPPTPPAVPINAIPLARFNVPALAGSIPTITDQRTSYQLCPSPQMQPALPTKLTFNAGDTIKFTADYPWCTRAVAYMEGAGAGGGGAATTAAGQVSTGRGGGAGGFARVEIIVSGIASVGRELTVVVGTGGTGGTGVAGANGGDTTLSDGVNTVTAHGGVGGSTDGANAGPVYSNIGGDGGAVTGLTTTGWVGEIEWFKGHRGLAGFNGGNGLGRGGNGGDSAKGMGGAGRPIVGSGAGSDGESPGAGGGGAYSKESTGATQKGGDGADGQVIVYLYDH